MFAAAAPENASWPQTEADNVYYADDCNIYVRSRRAGERVMASVIDVLQTIIDVGTICTPDRPRAARNTLPSECNVNLVMLRSMG